MIYRRDDGNIGWVEPPPAEPICMRGHGGGHGSRQVDEYD